MQQAISLTLRIPLINKPTAIIIPKSPSQSSSSSSHKRPNLVSYPPSSICISPSMKQESRRVSLRNRVSPVPPMDDGDGSPPRRAGGNGGGCNQWLEAAAFRRWRFSDLGWMIKNHPIPCLFACLLVFFMAVEYTLRMVPPSSPPYDLGFVATRWFHCFLASRPQLNTVLAALNTVYVGMQIVYILWALLIEGRARPGIAALFMFTCRGILGYSTQLPLPEQYLGSGADFPVGNVSFFLFYSGHVASAVIMSLDLRRMQRKELAWVFDLLNALQIVRLLATRGHYTIDLGVGIGAGILFDSLAGKYEECKAISPASYAPLEDKERIGGNGSV